MIQLVFFASVREQLGCSEYQVAHCGGITVDELLTLVAQELGEDAANLFADANLLVAINQEMAARTDKVNDSDEVAVFPPVTGG